MCFISGHNSSDICNYCPMNVYSYYSTSYTNLEGEIASLEELLSHMTQYKLE